MKFLEKYLNFIEKPYAKKNGCLVYLVLGLERNFWLGPFWLSFFHDMEAWD
jgi:hypothetical protein